jgi:hypothetical protein
MPDHIKDWTIVLQLGAEGGSLTLYGMQTERGWLFSRSLDDWSPELIGEERPRVQQRLPGRRFLVVPDNISLLFLPPYAPELNPKENLWDEIREKIFKNYALKSIDAVRAKLKQAILYIERNPKTVQSITSFPLYRQVTLTWKWYEIPEIIKPRGESVALGRRRGAFEAYLGVNGNVPEPLQ